MKNEKILEMLNAGQVEELKAILKQEIYKSSLTAGAKQRLAAMKRYFKYGINNGNQVCLFPYKREDGMTCFVDGYSCVITKESAEGMEHYNEAVSGTYLDVSQFLADPNDTTLETFYGVDLMQYIAKAKADGYKYSQKNLDVNEHEYTLIIHDHYFNMGRIDKIVSILNDGNGFTVQINQQNPYTPIFVSSSVGRGMCLPYRWNGRHKGNYYNLEF